MPKIYKVSCDQCEYAERFSSTSSYFIWKGEEILLRHPVEHSSFHRITGESLFDAKEKGIRVFEKWFWICLNCGEGDKFESAPEVCPSCEGGPMSFPYNKPLSASIRDQTEKYSAPCPLCNKGVLSTQMVAKS